MTKLERLYAYQRQSPWLDNLTRPYLRDGTLAAFVAAGIRGVTANPTILAKAILASDLYDAQFFALAAAGCSVEDAYWELAVHDVTDALVVLRPTYDNSCGSDGFVSIEVAPELAREHRGHDRRGGPSIGRGSSGGVQPGDAQFWFDERVEPGRQTILACAGLSSGGSGVVEQTLQQSQVDCAPYLGVGSGQIPYGAGAQPNDALASDDLLAVGR